MMDKEYKAHLLIHGAGLAVALRVVGAVLRVGRSMARGLDCRSGTAEGAVGLAAEVVEHPLERVQQCEADNASDDTCMAKPGNSAHTVSDFSAALPKAPLALLSRELNKCWNACSSVKLTMPPMTFTPRIGAFAHALGRSADVFENLLFGMWQGEADDATTEAKRGTLRACVVRTATTMCPAR